MSNAVLNGVQKLLADQRIRYMIVGGINTVLGLGSFTLIQLAIGRDLGRAGYLFSLIASYAIAIPFAFLLHRKYVFQVRGKFWLDFGRFVTTNLIGIGLNVAVLALLVEVARIDPIIAQPITTVAIVIATYFLHKYFSFRRR